MQSSTSGFRRSSHANRLAVILVALAAGCAGICQSATAATLCVDSRGGQECYANIGDAINAAAPGDTISVAHGTYKESVVITKSLSLVGESDENTIIDATGAPWGINIDGHGNPGLSDVQVTGFTVENANFAGILVANASSVTLADNRIINNDQGLVTTGASPTCPNLPAFFQRGENLDCGEGVLLSGVDHSVIANNTVTGNAGGILVTDDTGATHDNLITRNSVVHNSQFDCGITLPSHSGAGVFHNTVAGNDSSYNGGPGVGIFAPGPGSKAYANVVVNNKLRGNGLPGVTMHNHAAPGVNGVPPEAPPPMFNDNVIAGNEISANAADTEDAATNGPTGINIFSLTPMSGTIIARNVIDQEAIDIAIKIPAAAVGAAPQVEIHLNNLPNNSVGLENDGTATVNATLNWWGCSVGPGSDGCASVTGTGTTLWAPWLTKPAR